MTKLLAFKPIIMVMILSLLPIFVRAEGASGGGGGRDIEAGFKSKVISLAVMATRMTSDQKKLLKFNPDAVLAKITSPGELNPECATGSNLRKLRKAKKMAFVFPENLNVVQLNCSDFDLALWNEKFKSANESENTFFLHEGLRTMKLDEGYDLSSSFNVALRADPNFEAQDKYRVLVRLFGHGLEISPTSSPTLSKNRCILQWVAYRWLENDVTYFEEELQFFVNAVLVKTSGKIYSTGTAERIDQQVLNGNGSMNAFRDDVYKLSYVHGCD
jgi:hypothetical protein